MRGSDRLIEAATSAHRERDASGRISPPSEWHDLPPEGREEVFERQLLARRIERLVDPSGLTVTARDVLDRARRLPQA